MDHTRIELPPELLKATNATRVTENFGISSHQTNRWCAGKVLLSIDFQKVDVNNQDFCLCIDPILMNKVMDVGTLFIKLAPPRRHTRPQEWEKPQSRRCTYLHNYYIMPGNEKFGRVKGSPAFKSLQHNTERGVLTKSVIKDNLTLLQWPRCA